MPFELENDFDNIVQIKVIGVGGGGNNAAMRIINDGVQNIETYLLNTETGTLRRANTRKTNNKWFRSRSKWDYRWKSSSRE